MTALVWLRRDLRVHDNPALEAAHSTGQQTYIVYVHDTEHPHAAGAASRWWLHHSLDSLNQTLGGKLTLLTGESATTIEAFCRDHAITDIFWNRDYTPHAVARDKSLKATLRAKELRATSFNGTLLKDPWDIRNKSGTPFKVFTPFWNTLRQMPMRPPVGGGLPQLIQSPQSCLLAQLGLLPHIPWDKGLAASWTPGEKGAEERLTFFIENTLEGYADKRDRADIAGTSLLSPHLHFGEISPIRLWHRLWQEREKAPHLEKDILRFLSELAWREFSAHLLFENPTLPDRPLKEEFLHFPWIDDYQQDLECWQQGKTGIPIVDAGMRELWHTGYMHNRVRMIAASLLIKNMLIPWQEGERWFWDTLVDADLANNSASWQWVAGCGADAAPYFRIFNPVLQGGKFDPEGIYVRKWVPELATMPLKYLHAPWEAPSALRKGLAYPEPIVDLKLTRERALSAFAKIRAAR